jgi:MFS family permease
VGISTTVLGIGLAVLRIAQLAALPLAALADHRGRVKVLGRVVVLGLLCTALAAASPSYWFFVACFALARPLLSASNALLQVLTVELSAGRERVYRLAWIAAGAGGGAGLSAVLHGLFRGANSFRILFAFALLPALLVPFLLRSLDETHHRGERASVPVRIGAVPKAFRRRLAIIAWLAFVIGVITGPANGFAFVYGERILHIQPSVVALVVSLSAITGFAGLWLSRWSSQRFGRRITVIVGGVATGGTSALAYFGGRTLFVAGYLVGVCAAAYFSPAASAMGNEIFPKRVRATAAGWVVVAGVVGATCGLFFFGIVADSTHVLHEVNALRLASLLTFVPLLPTLLLALRLPETRDVEID